jgi:ferredoxin
MGRPRRRIRGTHRERRATARDEFVSTDREDEVVEASETCPEQAIIVTRDET